MPGGVRTNGELSEIGQKIIDVLSDGATHLRKELIACIGDETADQENLNPFLYNLRKHLRPKGIDIVCIYWNRRIAYRMVRLLKNPNRD